MALAAYETEPIGADGLHEAVAAYHFCDLVCRSQYLDARSYLSLMTGEDNEVMDGEVCEWCGKPFQTEAA